MHRGSRLLILSDIHANLEALEAVLQDIASLPEPGGHNEPVVCLGDMVGYGADPEAVVRRMRESSIVSVLGNHEAGVLTPYARRHFNPQAWDAVRFAAENLSRESLDWLAGLPPSLTMQGCRFVHGLPPADAYGYLSQADEALLRRLMGRISEDVCFVGHTHRLKLVSIRRDAVTRNALPEGTVHLERGPRHIVNAGAVGQPRDGDPRAKYLIFDPVSRALTVRYVPYDARAAAGKILASGQPRVYAERLVESMGGPA
ncbi:MAG: metallophosphoesterase family protein [Acidobacteriota bacterium]